MYKIVFLICRISGILTICYFSELFHILKFKKISTFFNEIHNYITLSLSKLEIKRLVDYQNVSESLNADMLNDLILDQELKEHLTRNFIT